MVCSGANPVNTYALSVLLAKRRSYLNKLPVIRRGLRRKLPFPLHCFPKTYLLELEKSCEEWKHDLVLSLYTHDIDPHNAILAIDAEEHENLYDIGYDPCYPNERTDHDNMESTKKAIEMYMHMLENSGRSVLPAAEARWKVLESEAVHEIEFHRSNAIRQFSSELDMCANKLALILEKMKLAVTRPSLIGVIGYGQGMM